MSNVVYSTEISGAIYRAWTFYTGPHKSQIKKNQAFLRFANACEREGKGVMMVVDILTRH